MGGGDSGEGGGAIFLLRILSNVVSLPTFGERSAVGLCSPMDNPPIQCGLPIPEDTQLFRSAPGSPPKIVLNSLKIPSTAFTITDNTILDTRRP